MKLVLLVIFLVVTVTLARDERKVMFQNVVYPKTESMSSNSEIFTMEHVYDDLGLTAQITIFTDGTVITTGNRDYILAPLNSATPRVLYKGTLDQELLDRFLQYIRQDGFLALPNHEKTEIKYGLICDTYTNDQLEHEVCRPEEASHDIIDQIESQIEQLLISAQSTFRVYVPDSIYVQLLPVDKNSCRRKIDSSSADLRRKYGYVAPGFFHYENVRPIWDDVNSRTCYTVHESAFAFVVTSKHVSVHFDESLIDPGFDESKNNVEPTFNDQDPQTGYDDNDNDYIGHSWNPTFVIIIGVVIILIFIITAAIRSKKQRAQNNTQFQNDNQMVAMQTFEPAYYVTQTANGPVYYQTNPNPMPQGLVYTVNQ